jgi:uncharacterized protein YbjQ (UPF0145 family)
MNVETVDATPLNECLQKIGIILGEGASSVTQKRDALWAIKDEIESAMGAFRENITKAQDAELAELRKAAQL